MATPVQAETIAPIRSLAAGEPDKSQLSEIALGLVSRFKEGKLSPEETANQAINLIRNIKNMLGENAIELHLARESLANLSQLPIAKIQNRALKDLGVLLSLETLTYDLNENQIDNLLKLEEILSSTIDGHLRKSGGSVKVLQRLLDVYNDILEHLWLLPQLSEDPADLSKVFERSAPAILPKLESWFALLSKYAERVEELVDPFHLTKGSLRRLSSHPPKQVIATVRDVKKMIRDPLLCGFLGQTYLDLGFSYRAQYCTTANLTKVEELEEVKGTSRQLKKYKGQLLGNLGNAFYSLGRYPEAIELYEKALAILKEIGDRRGEGAAYGSLGSTYEALGRYPEAIESHEKALAISQEIGDRQREGQDYGNLGNDYRSLGRYREAIESHEKRLAIAKEIGDRRGEGNAYGNLGNAYDSLGRYPEAIESYEKALAISQEIGDRRGEGQEYGNLGSAYEALGKYPEAIESHEKALAISQEIGDRQGEGNAYGNLGVAYKSLGRYPEAIESYEKALAISQEIGDRRGEGNAFGNLGNAYDSLGRYPEAIELQKKRLAISQEIGDRRGEGQTYGNLGIAYRSLGRVPEAIESHEKALAISQEIGDRRGEGQDYGNLGNAYYSLGRYPEAIESHEKALAISQEIGDADGKASGYHNLAFTQEQMGHNEKALTSYEKAIGYYSQIRMSLKKDSNKITIFEEQSKPHLAIEGLFSRSDQVQKALLQTESRRALSLADSIVGGVRVPLKIEKLQEYALSQRTTLVYFSLSPLTRKRQEAYVWVISPKEELSYQALPLDEVSKEINGLQEFMKDYPFSGGEGRNPKIQTVSSVEELTHDPREDPTLIPKLRAFKEKLMLWYDTFIEPIEKSLPEKGARLTMMLDGFLSQLPFAIFWDGEEYLIEKYEVAFAPSVQILNLLERRKTSREPVEGSLVVGNPLPGLEAKELPKAEEEAGKVAELLGTRRESRQCRDKATVIAAKAAMKSARFIHLACHGDPTLYTNIHSVYRGGFLMTPDEGHRDGVLHAEEIAKQKLSAELVFLSACNSGRGKIKREGVIGHMRSFLAAGADSVIGTLWTLPDSDLTVHMVERFYTCILEGKTKSAAFREMMLFGIEKDRGNPQNWGAFFLTGLSGRLMTEKERTQAVSDAGAPGPVEADEEVNSEDRDQIINEALDEVFMGCAK